MFEASADHRSSYKWIVGLHGSLVKSAHSEITGPPLLSFKSHCLKSLGNSGDMKDVAV